MLNKPSGNMYPWAWTWNPIGGKCIHQCLYCYVSKAIAPRLKRFGNEKYYGKPLLIESELKTSLKKPDDGKVIFVEACGDLFARNIPSEYIWQVIRHCEEYPENTYLFQSKNPMRFDEFCFHVPVILGTTLESNKVYDISKAPSVINRYVVMKHYKLRKMISIEPILDFNLDIFVRMIKEINPSFVSIGADSKNVLKKLNIPEPSSEKTQKFIAELEKVTEVRTKKNLGRLLR